MKGRLRIEIKGNQGKEGCICRHHRVLYRMGRTELKSRAELNNVRDPHGGQAKKLLWYLDKEVVG